MKNPFKPHKSYRILHRILKTLYDEAEATKKYDKPLGSIEIAKRTGIPIKDIHFYHELLKESNEITCCENNGQHLMTLKEAGTYAYLRNKHLKEGNAEVVDRLYNPVKIILPIFTFLLSVFVIYLNWSTNNKIQKLEDKVRQLETRIQQQSPISGNGTYSRHTI